MTAFRTFEINGPELHSVVIIHDPFILVRLVIIDTLFDELHHDPLCHDRWHRHTADISDVVQSPGTKVIIFRECLSMDDILNRYFFQFFYTIQFRLASNCGNNKIIPNEF